MPDEALISQIETLLAEVVELGAAAERTRMVPNLLVTDIAPTGLTGFITVKDDRDGDNILARKVPSVVYTVNDLVNVLFVRGGEAIAFQQGSQSGNGGLWEIVPSTTTDIFYNKGDVGVGKSVAPDASLEILSTAQAQLRLTHTEDTKFVDFTLDTNHDLTITPSSTGQIIFQPTTDSTDFFQVLDADGGTPVFNIDSTNERVGIGTTGPDAKLDVLATTTQLRLTHTDGSKFVDFTLDTNHDLTITPSSTGQVVFQPTTDSTDFFQVLDADGGTPVLSIDSTNEFVGIGVSPPTEKLHVVTATTVDGATAMRLTHTGIAAGTANGMAIAVTGASGFQNIGLNISVTGAVSFNRAIVVNSGDCLFAGQVAIGTTSLAAQLRIDQASTTAAIPVAYFDQADVSEEMFEFATTIGTGNAIEAIGAKTLTTTHFIKVTIPGGLTRYFPVGTIA